ncbi:MAG: hypothetical protein ACFFDN_52795, partial [Candidatus Hodarchaeota archaeon]
MGEIPTKKVSLEVKSISDLKVLKNFPEYWRDITSFLVIHSEILSIKDKQGLIKRLRLLNVPIHIESYSWWFTHPRIFRNISELEKNRNLLFLIQNLSEDLIIDGWKSTILDYQNFEFVDNWFIYQKELSEILLKKEEKIELKIKSLRKRLVKEKEIKIQLESFSLPYIPILDIRGYEDKKLDALNANIEIINYFLNKFSGSDREHTCPSIVINFKTIKWSKLQELIQLIKNNFKKSWIWFVDVDDRKLSEGELRVLWKFLRKINKSNDRIFRLRLGGFLSQRFLRNEFNSICSFIDGWGIKNFTINYYEEEEATHYFRKRHIFYPQYGNFISSSSIIKEIESKKCNFNCECSACNSLYYESKLTIPKMEYKRSKARKEEKRLTKSEIGISQPKQSEFVKIHDLICFYNLINMNDKDFNNISKNWPSPGINKWKKVKN